MNIDGLQTEHEALLGFVYMCPVGVLRTAMNGDVQMINPHAAQMLLPLTRTPMLYNLFDALEDCAPELRDLVARFSDKSGSICQQHRIFVSQSGPGPRVVSCTLLKMDPERLMAVLQDVTQQVDQERLLRQNEAMFAALVAAVNDFTLFFLDSGGRVSSWNPSGQQQTGYPTDEIMGRDLRTLLVPGDDRVDALAEQVQAAMREGWSIRECWCVRRDGSRYWCQIMVAAIQETRDPIPEDGMEEHPAGTGFAVVLRDVTERHVTGEELRRLLTTDHLTGATNRARFFDLAETEIARLKRDNRPLSAIMLDIDHFKQVNDRLGHAGGDLMLQRLVTLCRSQLRGRDVLARMGGEEFAILLPDTDLPEAVRIAERIRGVVASDIALPNVPCLEADGRATIAITVSLGCAMIGKSTEGIDALLKAADTALYEAKRGGRDQVRSAVDGERVLEMT